MHDVARVVVSFVIYTYVQYYEPRSCTFCKGFAVHRHGPRDEEAPYIIREALDAHPLQRACAGTGNLHIGAALLYTRYTARVRLVSVRVHYRPRGRQRYRGRCIMTTTGESDVYSCSRTRRRVIDCLAVTYRSVP